MDGRDPDGELVEFRPWSQFPNAPSQDWRPYLAAAMAVVFLGGGWFVWKSSRPSNPAELAIGAEVAPRSTSLTVPVPTEPTVTVPADTLLSEADLMALAGPSDLAAMTAAEEAVFVYFTAPPPDDRSPDPDATLRKRGPDTAPGYVEWAHAIDVVLAEGESIVTVRFSVLALAETPWRLPTRTVEVTMRSDATGWTVVGFPRLVDGPLPVQWAMPDLGEVPEELRIRLESAGWEVIGGEELEDGWHVAVADPTGAVVMIDIDQLEGE